MARPGILSNTGTSEVEILEFSLNGQHFGLDVLNVRAIEQYDPARVTRLHLAPPPLVGTLLFRGKCVTLIDLGGELEPDQAPDRQTIGPESLVLVMEFADCLHAFAVEAVNRIHRVGRDTISPLHAFLDTPDTLFTGSLHLDAREILLLDIGRIVAGLAPRPAPAPCPA